MAPSVFLLLIFFPTFSKAFERGLGLDVVVQNFAAAAKGWLQKGD